jgi:hypothetical protein
LQFFIFIPFLFFQFLNDFHNNFIGKILEIKENLCGMLKNSENHRNWQKIKNNTENIEKFESFHDFSTIFFHHFSQIFPNFPTFSISFL